jgi:hypothetical protein
MYGRWRREAALAAGLRAEGRPPVRLALEFGAVAGAALSLVDGTPFCENLGIFRGALAPLGDNARREDDGTGGGAGADQEG